MLPTMSSYVDKYYNDSKTQRAYKERVDIIVEEIKHIYGKSVKLDVHLPMIRELAQAEIACRKYSKLIANDLESDTTANLLKNERMQMNRLREQLGISMTKIEKAAQDRGGSDSDDLMDEMDDIFTAATKKGDLDVEELKKELKEEEDDDTE